ncbi:MAG: hypothetical protein NTY14_06090 [Candidatus Omnitrophica bacterium]|nr:hypothetical protein [Candidatus Omnitrophota bacterium]
MISRRRKIKFFLPLIISALLFFPRHLPASDPKNDEAQDYQQLIQLYNECISLEESNFNKLSFRLSPKQLVKTGSNLKLTLLDDFDRPWILKVGWIKGDLAYKSAVGYRIYRLFGLNCPEMHVMHLVLNGKELTGSLQRYVDNAVVLKPSGRLKLAPEAVNFLLKAQVLDWLLKNEDPRFWNFLVLSEDKGIINNLCRIDLDSLLFEENNAYNHEYMFYYSESGSTSIEWNCYYRILQEYKSGLLDIDWKGNYPFVEFVSDLPDDFLKLQLLPIKTQRLESSEGELEKYNGFLEPIIQIKKNLRVDFGKFYDNLPKGAGNEKGYVATGKKREIDRACDNLALRIKQLRDERAMVDHFTPHPAKIEARVSLEGYKIMQELSLSASNGKISDSVFDQAWRELSRIEKEATTESEKETISYYKKQMGRIRAGKVVELVPTEIDDHSENRGSVP